MVFASICIYTLVVVAVILWSRSYADLLLSFGSAAEILSTVIVYDFYFPFVIRLNFRFQWVGERERPGKAAWLKCKEGDRRKGDTQSRGWIGDDQRKGRESRGGQWVPSMERNAREQQRAGWGHGLQTQTNLFSHLAHLLLSLVTLGKLLHLAKTKDTFQRA